MDVLILAVQYIAPTYASRNMSRIIPIILAVLCAKILKDFVVIQLEQVLLDPELEDFRKHESSWVYRIDTLHAGKNRQEMPKPPAPPVPAHGFGTTPIGRSRHPDRIAIPNVQARNWFTDELSRTMYLKNIVHK